MNADQVLVKIKEEVSACKRCALHHSRLKGVPGEGPPDAEIMFIGEGPGYHENNQGRPFVGAAGNLLVELLGSIGLKREDVFITNVVECRPPGNRDPQPDELAACNIYLERQIQAINPKVIVTLGRFSMARYFPKSRISAIHGQTSVVNGRLIMPMYHPAAALHQPSLRRTVKADFALIPELIARTEQVLSQEDVSPSDPEQLSLF